jgi:hypothetical protein
MLHLLDIEQTPASIEAYIRTEIISLNIKLASHIVLGKNT